MWEGIPLWVHNQRWGLDCHFWRFKIFAWHNCSFRLIDKFLESWQVFLWPLSVKRRVLLCLDLIFKCKLLKFQFVSFYKFLDLVKSSETFRSEVLKLFDCFPDEDWHLMRFCRLRPKAMTVGEILTLSECPSCTQGKRGVERCVSICPCPCVHAIGLSTLGSP